MVFAYAKETDEYGRVVNIYTVNNMNMAKSRVSKDSIIEGMKQGLKVDGLKLDRVNDKVNLKIAGRIPEVTEEPEVVTVVSRTYADFVEDSKYRVITNTGRCGVVDYRKLLVIYNNGRVTNMKLNGNSKKLCLMKGTLEVI